MSRLLTAANRRTATLLQLGTEAKEALGSSRSHTVRKRSQVLSNFRSQIAGGEKASPSQLADELSTSDRKLLLEKAGIKPNIPVGQGLAMKARAFHPME